MHFYGIASIEFKRDPRTGRFVLIEINGRSHTQNYLATACGINLPYILYKDLMGEKICFKHDACGFKQDVSWIHFTIDFLSMMKKRRRKELTLKEWLQSILVGERTHAIFSADDLRPFISELKVIWSHLLTHGVDLLRLTLEKPCCGRYGLELSEM
ncbi:MAG: hypothetical protein QXX08_02410 [Candidatus Bathyarchaeia archaeon]